MYFSLVLSDIILFQNCRPLLPAILKIHAIGEKQMEFVSEYWTEDWIHYN